MSGSYPKHNRTRTAASGLIRFALIVALFFPMPAFAQDALRGVALVIGQSEYEHLSPLPNPANDADAIETLLSDLGFDSVRRADRKAANLTKDLERFAEDAEGADVAVLYYSGHGIEAGGENWLVPVDADLSALDDAGEKLVPVSALIDKLKATVPVVIVMLDACRNNPFPPGSELRLSPGAEPIAVGNSGLALSRSVVSLKATSETAPAPDENVGTVIAFAAEPGKVALDGDAGSNSPYAAALLRHFDAMAGEEFGMVMRMVAEEVYLKTGGRQRPWVNESLRRLLYFGEKPTELSGDEGDILRERRGLLITIAALPDPERRQVESAALNGNVPMDALYGVLRALGRDAPDDPEKLEELLKTESERIAKILSDRAAISSPDPEIIRVSALADTAEQEGLLIKADELRNRAKQRFREIEGTLEQQEAALNQRFVEGAEVFARSAQTKAMSFDHLGAAGDYEEAVRLVDGRDAQKAWFYANARLLALTDHGKYKGDNAALEQAVIAGQGALRLADRAESLRDRASTQNNLGNALLTLGERDRSVARYEEAAAAYRAALQGWSRDREPFDWATAQSNLGVALRGIGERESGLEKLEESVDAFNKALEVRTRFRSPHGWSETKINLGNTLLTMGHRGTGVEKFQAAVAVYRDVLDLWTRDYEPMGWAAAQNNLGMALSWSGGRNGNAKTLNEALEAFDRALEVRTRERAPMVWAATMANMGQAYTSLGLIENDEARLREAIETYRLVLGEFTRERTPLQWATASLNLGNALQHLGTREAGVENLNAAVAQYDAVLEEFTREVSPVDWGMTQHNLGMALGLIGERTSDEAALLASEAAFRASLLERQRDRFPHLWAEGQQNLGMTLARLGVLKKDMSAFDEAAAAFRNALQELNRENNLANWAVSTTLLAYTTRELGQQGEGEKSLTYLEEAVQAFRNLASAQSRAEKPGPWASTQNDIGYLLVLIGEQRGDLARLEEAQVILADALAVQRQINDPSIPYVADSLCRAKRNIGMLKSDRAVLLEAKALCEQSVAAFAAVGNPQAGQATENLEQVDALIAKVQ